MATWKAVLLTIVVLVVVAFGYGQYETDSANSKVEHSGIQIGYSITEVREILGKPRSEQTFDNGEATIDTNLYYGDYQLVFEKGYLSAKNKY